MSEIHGSVGAYVAGALEPAAEAEFEAHLTTCETCAGEVAEFREATAELSLLVASPPPPALRASVLAAIGGVRVLPPEATRARPSDPVAVDVPAPVDELAARRRDRSTRLLALAVAAVTLVAVGLGGWVVSLLQREAPVASATAETELLRAPDLRAYTIALKDGGTATFVASRSLDRAMFSSGDLPALPPGRTYQLWTLAGPLDAPTRVTPDALVAGGTPVKAWFTGPVGQSDALAISVEPEGGAAAPTNIQGATAL